MRIKVKIAIVMTPEEAEINRGLLERVKDCATHEKRFLDEYREVHGEAMHLLSNAKEYGKHLKYE